MYKGKRIAVVVPAYNEAGFVGDVIETVPDFVDRIYAVDDASTDDTWDEMKAAAAAVNRRRVTAPVVTPDGGTTAVTNGDGTAFRRRVVTVQLAENSGVGAAITTGYRMAADDGMDVVAVMNADGQMDPDILDRIVDPVVEGRADYAKGNRLARPEYRASMSNWRLFGNTVLTLLTKIASGYWGTVDPQNGYTAISREAIEQLDLDAVYDRYGFCNDMLVRANVNRFRVVDVGMPAVYGEESSHIEYSSFVPSLSLLLLKRFHWRLRERYVADGFHPIAALYGLGEAGLFASLAHGLWALASIRERAEDGRNAVTEALGSVVLLLVAMFYDSQTSTHLEDDE